VARIIEELKLPYRWSTPGWPCMTKSRVASGGKSRISTLL
jgi:hypothetical protein